MEFSIQELEETEQELLEAIQRSKFTEREKNQAKRIVRKRFMRERNILRARHEQDTKASRSYATQVA